MVEVSTSQDGVAPIRMVDVSASVNLPLHHEVQKFPSGTGSPGRSRKRGRKTVVVVVCSSYLFLDLGSCLLTYSLCNNTFHVMLSGRSYDHVVCCEHSAVAFQNVAVYLLC